MGVRQIGESSDHHRTVIGRSLDGEKKKTGEKQKADGRRKIVKDENQKKKGKRKKITSTLETV